jgi:ABC-type sugar transport system ATPase subunit
MTVPFLEFDTVSKAFRGVKAIDSVSLSVPRGHVRALLGENGAGKSTLIKMLTGAYATDSGEIRLDGRRIDNQPPATTLDQGVVAIYQEFNLIPQLTVAENIFLGRFPGRRRWLDRKGLSAAAEKILQRLGVPIDPDARIESLNVAEQQLVEIAKALSRELRVLVMDEPTAALSDTEIAILFEIIRGLRASDVCILYISHRMSEIFALADTVSVLKDGRTVGTHDVGAVDRDSLVRMMIGRELGAFYPPKGEPTDGEVFSVTDLRIAGRLDVGSLSVRKGEIVGVAGLEGQGQREFARALGGAETIDAGEIRIHGAPVDVSSPARAIAAGIGFIPDDRKQEGLALLRSCAENIALASLDRRRALRFFVDRPAERSFVKGAIEALQVKLPSSSQAVADLSGGNQQKVVLAKALGMQPKVLVLAEPTRGVDVGAKREIYNIMRDLAAKGVGVLMVSSELPELIGMCDRILVMAGGSIVEVLSGPDITEEAIMRAATHEHA